jgi:hypothetical protein
VSDEKKMGLAQSNLNWTHLTDYLFALRQNEVSAILFRQSALSDPCVLIGSSLPNLATDYAKKSNLGLYATGYGQCTHCTKPTIYTWSSSQDPTTQLQNGNWVAYKSTVPGDLSNQLYTFADNNNLNYLYFVKTDENQKVTDVASVYHREGKTLHPLPGCNPQKKNSLQMLGKNANIIIIVLIIILILFLLWVVFSGCKNKQSTSSVKEVRETSNVM